MFFVADFVAAMEDIWSSTLEESSEVKEDISEKMSIVGQQQTKEGLGFIVPVICFQTQIFRCKSQINLSFKKKISSICKWLM